ncbi:helix-turn-helix domain-containing protein [Superficieibacter sp. BNK-5]|uniref:helix-turn-helix domain-containing protein n=1 Tax=Superficieibacter sp. BNK-5 TaxID=3376142 RepID=UPI0039BF2045
MNSGRRWPKGERVIAKESGVVPEKIWPSRYGLPEKAYISGLPFPKTQKTSP